MKRSNFFLPIGSDLHFDNCNRSLSYFEQMGMIQQIGSGIYSHLPGMYKLTQNLKQVLNKHLLNAGCSQHHFPALQPTSNWEDQGRLELFGKSMFVFDDQHGKRMCVAPTHEVTAALTAKRFIKSYRQLPIRLSQIQTKYRDETRPRGGLLRTREFTMHDLYSFDRDLKCACESYRLIRQAYEATLSEVGLPFVVREQADMGSIGGDCSHEFHVPADIGEDGFENPNSGDRVRTLEVAHIFMLGDKYSKPAAATFVDKDGQSKNVYMCSFGLGIERTIAAYVEVFHEPNKDLLWSWALAPFKIMILGNDTNADMLYNQLLGTEFEPIIDDRDDVFFGQKIKEAHYLGIPVYIIFGKKFTASQLIEVRVPRLETVEFMSLDSLRVRLPEIQAKICEREQELALQKLRLIGL